MNAIPKNKKSQSAKSSSVLLQKEQEDTNTEVVDSLSQYEVNILIKDSDGQSVSDGSEIPIVRRSARKSFVSGSYSLKGTLKLKDTKVMNEKFQKSMEDPILMTSKNDLDGKLKLPKNKIIQQHLTPTVKPKDTSMKENGGKENLSPDPEIDPMIFEGNFPILKLHRVDERPLSVRAKGSIRNVVSPAEVANTHSNDEQEDDEIMNGRAESFHAFKVDDAVAGDNRSRKKVQPPISVDDEIPAISDDEESKENALTVSEIVNAAVRQAEKKLKLEFRRELQKLIDKYRLPETVDEEEQVESSTNNTRDISANKGKKRVDRRRH